MSILNVFAVAPIAPVVATDDANAATGNQSVKWGGIDPDFQTGATGNVNADDGLSYTTASAVYVDEVVKKIVAITFSEDLEDNVNNFCVTPLANLGVTTPKKVVGIVKLGVYNPASTETGAAPTPSLIQVPAAIICSIIKDRLVVKIPDTSRDLFQGNTLYVELTFRA